MSILPAQHIRRLCSPSDRVLPLWRYRYQTGQPLVSPFSERTVHPRGMSYGLSHAGYDIRIAQTIHLDSHGFALASSIEHICVPDWLMVDVKDKSSWVRQGLRLANTVLEPGWRGHITLELFCGPKGLTIEEGTPIAQLVFCELVEATANPYAGKYQDQPAFPVAALQESVPPVDRSAVQLTGGGPVPEDRSHTRLLPSGQQQEYVVLSPEERARGFVRPVRRSYLHQTCQSVTTMSLPLAETYARDPSFYSGTFCAFCRSHFHVNQFVWEGTTEVLGS